MTLIDPLGKMHPSDSIPSKLRLSAQGLQQVDARLNYLGWRKQSKYWAHKANVGVATLKRFRARNRVTADAFQSICQALGLGWQDLAEPYLPVSAEAEEPFDDSADGGLDEIWVSRGSVFQSLTHHLNQGCRILVLTGITGIGKTVLAAQLTQRFQPKLGPHLVINLDMANRTKFVDIATDCLAQVGQVVTEEERHHPPQLMQRWLHLLIHDPHWVVMDSLEALMQGDEHNGWSVFNDPLWDRFFHQLLGSTACASQLVLTSQEVPSQLQVHGWRYPERFQVQPIKGLSPDAQVALLRGYDFQPEDAESWSYLLRIGAAYEGHPLALQVILGEIRDHYGGQVVRYWQQYGAEIEVVEQAKAGLAAPGDYPQLDRYSCQLRNAVRDRIDKTFMRLRHDLPDAYLLLCTTAVYRIAVDEAFLLGPFLRRGWSPRRGQVALDTLLERHLLEINSNNQFRQHNLIRSVALDHFQQLDAAS